MEFVKGDRVKVLNACRLPAIEEVRHVGVIESLSHLTGGPTLYWISGLALARTADVLRHAVDDAHLLVQQPPRTLAQQWAEEDEQRHDEETAR